MKLLKALVLLCLSMTLLNAKELLFSTAYRLAIENSNKIHATNYMHLADEETINQEKAALYPQLDLSAYYKKTDYTTNPDKDKIEQGLLNYTFSLKQSIYNASTYSRIAMQKSRSKYSLIKVKLQKQQLAQDVFQAYLNVLKAENKIEALQSYMEYQHSKLDALQKKYDMKLANKMDLLEIKVKYNSSKIDLNKEKRLLDVYKLQLQHFIGKDNYQVPIIDIENNLSPALAEMRDTVSDKINSLEVREAAIGVEISNKTVENAFDGHLPSVSFNASYARYTTDTPTIEAPYSHVESAMVNINIPIYKGGYTSSKVEAAKLKYKAAIEDMLDTKKKIDISYSEDLTNFNAALDSVNMYKESYASAKLFVEAVTEGYHKGLKSIVDLNDAEAKMYDIKYKYIDNLYTMVNAYVGLLIETNSFDNIRFLDQLLEASE